MAGLDQFYNSSDTSNYHHHSLTKHLSNFFHPHKKTAQGMKTHGFFSACLSRCAAKNSVTHDQFQYQNQNQNQNQNLSITSNPTYQSSSTLWYNQPSQSSQSSLIDNSYSYSSSSSSSYSSQLMEQSALATNNAIWSMIYTTPDCGSYNQCGC